MTQIRPPSAAPLRDVCLETSAGPKRDVLAVEAPLQLSLNGRRYAVLMRTPESHPNSDLDLCIGFLFSEGVIEDLDDVASVGYCSDPSNTHPQNAVIVHLQSGASVPKALRSLDRATAVGSACGVCGRMDIDALSPPFPKRIISPKPDLEFVLGLPAKLRSYQNLFAQTGGLHGAALFDSKGQYLTSAEDVGRHNAVDKVIGNRIRRSAEDLVGSILVVSSRLSFDLVQKSLMANLSSIVGVGAASDLAHTTAHDHGLHLFSFTRADSTNYHL